MNKIIKVFIVFALVYLSTLKAYSQSPIFGFNLGGNLSYHSISGSSNTTSKSRYAFFAGAFLEFNIGKIIKLTPELNYVLKGANIQYTESDNLVTEIPTKLYYISFPINGKIGLNVTDKIYAYFLAGPRLDINIDYNDNGLIGLYTNRNNINIGGNIGLGLSYNKDNRRLIGVELRFNSDFSKFPVDKYTYKGIITNYAAGTQFRNESLELLLKIGFK
jgi:hypothetical protein